MKLTIRSFYYILLSLAIPSNVITLQKQYVDQRLRARIKRQEGYVYDKPNVSFDLPSRSTTESTQAPTVDRTLVQQISYTYPAPPGGNTINIGSTGSNIDGSSASAPSNGARNGYNYRSSGTSIGDSGYNYGSSGSSEVQQNTRAQITSIGSQTVANVQSGSSQASSGYANNAPSPTLSPSLQGPSSTNAPKYLPPVAGSGKENSGIDNTVTVSGASNSGQIGTSIGIPSDNYLPPVSNTGISIPNTISSLSTGTQVNSGNQVSVPNTAYLPPISAPAVGVQSLPTQLPPSSSQPATPTGVYIPPSNMVSNSVSVSTPASGYLPPRFF